MLIIAIPIGLLIGISLGALGGGGSILTVPALVYLLHQQPHAATTGSLLIVGITAIAGMAAHRRAGRVRFTQGITFGAVGVAGSYAGTHLSAGIKPDLLLTLFAGLMVVAAAAMLRRRRPATSGQSPVHKDQSPVHEEEPASPTAVSPLDGPAAPGWPGAAMAATLERPARTGHPPAAAASWPSLPGGAATRRGLKIAFAATAVGLLTGFFGVGGGFVIVPALVLALGFDMPAAVGTSLLVIAINSAAALAARLGSHVHLDWPLLAAFTLAALAGTLAGNRIASRVDAARLTVAFTMLLIAVAVYSLCRSVPGLV
jgi:uncharacterized membrane protein YfcA